MTNKMRKHLTLYGSIAVLVVVAGFIVYALVNPAPKITKFPVTGDLIAIRGDALYVDVVDVDHPNAKVAAVVYVNASTTIEGLGLSSGANPHIVSKPLGLSDLAAGERISVSPVLPVTGHLTAQHITVLPGVAPRAAQ